MAVGDEVILAVEDGQLLQAYARRFAEHLEQAYGLEVHRQYFTISCGSKRATFNRQTSSTTYAPTTKDVRQVNGAYQQACVNS